jgi:plasmid maintenance system antidote protein VapI
LTLNYDDYPATPAVSPEERLEMKTTEYLQAVKSRLGISSDYALAARLGITRSAVSKMQQGESVFSDDVALTVAELLDVEPMAVIAAANAERAKTPEAKARWTGLMEKFSVSFRNRLSKWDGVDRRATARLFAH